MEIEENRPLYKEDRIIKSSKKFRIRSNQKVYNLPYFIYQESIVHDFKKLKKWIDLKLTELLTYMLANAQESKEKFRKHNNKVYCLN